MNSPLLLCRGQSIFFSNHLLFEFTVCICRVQEKQVIPVAATNHLPWINMLLYGLVSPLLHIYVAVPRRFSHLQEAQFFSVHLL